MSTQFHAKNSFPSLYKNMPLKQYWKDPIENGELPAIDDHGNTIIHLLASDGNATAISDLVKDGLLKAEHLQARNNAGDTPLHQAARFGKKDVAEVLFEKVVAGRELELELCSALNSWDETPIYLAAAYGWEKMFYYLKGRSSRDVMLGGRIDGWTILHALVMAEYYEFALRIAEEYPELVDRRDKEGMTALHILASSPNSFRSCSEYTVINLGLGTFIPRQLIGILIYYCAPSFNWEVKSSSGDGVNPNCSSPSSMNEANPSSSFLSLLSSAISSGYAKIFTACPAIKEISDMKKKHGYAELLAEKLVKETKEWSLPSNLEDENNWELGCPSEVQIEQQADQEMAPLESYENGKKNNSWVKKRAPSNPLLEAARNMIIELVRLIIEKCPQVANAAVDEDGKNVLHVAAECKSIYIYEYLMKSKFIEWDVLRLAVDRFGNTIWHHAACIGTGPRVLFGPRNFMAWDTFWFKLVGRDCYPYLQEHRNCNGFTAMELYFENHKSMREEATKEIKDMNQGLMLVSALVGTVNYSALMGIPGGYNQENGMPIFSQRGDVSRDLSIFMNYVAGALLASILALGSQLAIQLSRFLYDDFFFSLSFKYIVAMTSLFYAANFSVLACAQVFVLQGILKARWYTFFWWPSVCSVLIYIDVMYMIFNQMYFLYLTFCTNKHSRQRSNRGVSRYLY